MYFSRVRMAVRSPEDTRHLQEEDFYSAVLSTVTGGRKRCSEMRWTLLPTRPVGMVDCNLI